MKIKIVLLALLALGLDGCGIHTVDTGHRGVKVRFGQVEGGALTEGLYFVNPFTTSIVQIDTRTQRWDDKTDAYTKDVQVSHVAFTLNYQLRPEAAATEGSSKAPDNRSMASGARTVSASMAIT